MSSILDALRKVEREKAASVAAAEGNLDDAAAAEELFGRRPAGQGMTVRLTPITIAVGGLALVGVLVAVSVGVSLLVARTAAGPDQQLATHVPATRDTAVSPPPSQPTDPGPQPTPPAPAAPAIAPSASDPTHDVPEVGPATPEVPLQVASVPPSNGDKPATDTAKPAGVDTPPVDPKPAGPAAPEGPDPAAATPSPPSTESGTPQDSPPVKPVASATPPEPAAARTTPPVHVASAVPVKPTKPETADPKPASATNDDPPPATAASTADVSASENKASTEPTSASPKPQPRAAADAVRTAERDGPLDVTKLPYLTERVRTDLGLPPLTLNLTGRVTSSVRPWALINWKKVYVGDTIPKTDAELIGVDVKGVGIEVRGQRYFVAK